MQNIEIKPLEGIVIKDIGEVLLGRHKNNVYTLLGHPSIDNKDRIFYKELEVRFDIDQHDNIEFIEFIYGPFPKNIELTIYDVNPFTIGANKLLKILSMHNQGDPDTSEAPYSYAFTNTSIGVWRDLAPEDIEPITEDNINDNYSEELKMVQNFWTIGIGVPNYYRL
ncbi:hypothetical protein [Mucilaginibacter auburnensis]|uniref:Uncharacterized protein n=1 Tax=Mucilaginibacter auburnensis TaxID=1457233 RepID=A0A2H9VQQ5_9SPHI|nr:hypothetical protein [Mucilaginibacter auburnensis]PJJ83166.1 hypothetical protein CLV57_0144 [Mucilaginibacter auburnensis]